MPDVALTPLPPAEAIRFFESKGFQIGFNWQDVWQQEHARAFTVAKAMRLDILQTIRQEVDTALRDGLTKEQFASALTPRLQALGWWGKAELPDPLTGQIKRVQLGSPRRLRIIYDTNLRMARAAGRWSRIERLKADRPFLMYVAVLDDRTRPEHREWHRIILPVDHPFWDTHAPPNGWNCRCILRQLSEADLERRGLKVSTDEEVKAFTERTRTFRNRRTGQVTQVPEGVDPGFSYNVGRAHMRGLAPPPRSGPLTTPAINPPPDMPLPPPRRAPASRLLAETSADEAVDRFLAEFGAVRGRPAVFADKLGEPVVVSEGLFLTSSGRNVLAGGVQAARRSRMLVLADTVKDPDEIWWSWERVKREGAAADEFVLHRFYLARFEIEGDPAPVLAGFSVGKTGWTGRAVLAADAEGFLRSSRRGTLAYRRPE